MKSGPWSDLYFKVCLSSSITTPFLQQNNINPQEQFVSYCPYGVEILPQQKRVPKNQNNKDKFDMKKASDAIIGKGKGVLAEFKVVRFFHL